MAAITSAQSGNWSLPTTWTGGVVPGDGDWPTITHAVVIDQNIGTAGNGIQNIVVNGASASLSVDNSAPRTILFASTGSNPTGSGTAANPGSDATMFGFYVARGSLSLVGTSSNKITINSGNGSSPWYIRHGGNDLGNSNVGAAFDIRYCEMTNLGANVAGFFGIYHERVSSTQGVVVKNNTFTNFYKALHAITPQTGFALEFDDNTGTGNLSDIVYLGGGGWSGFEITGNSFSAPAATGTHLFYAINGAHSFLFENNSFITESTTNKIRLININAAGTNGTVRGNTVRNPLTSSVTPQSIVLQGDGPYTVEGNTIVGGKYNTNSLTQTVTIERNFFYITTTNLGTSHAPLEINGCVSCIIKNNIILVNYGANSHMGIFTWDISDVGGVAQKTSVDFLGIYYNTIVALNDPSAQNDFAAGIRIGQGGDPVGNVNVVGNLVANFENGIMDGDNTGGENSFNIVSNNLTYNCTNNYRELFTSPSPGFSPVNSRTGDPKFANAGGTTAPDYFITAGGDGVEYGETTYAPDDDFIGEPRALTPSIGAYDGVLITDDTAPVLTSPTATATGPTTATASVTTDDGNGTLYFLASTNATESAATVKAALSQSVTADGAQSISLSALDPETTYYVHFVQINGASLESVSVVTTNSITTQAVPPVVYPVISATVAASSTSAVSATVTTDTVGGTIYGVLSTSATGMEAADIKSGADDTATVTDAGDYTINETGLATWTQYYWHIVHEDADGLMSNVLAIPVRTLDIPTPLAFSDTAPATLLTVQVWSKMPKKADVEGLY